MPLPLAEAIFWVAAVCCVVAQYFILRGTAAASSAAPARSASATAEPSRRTTEIVWAVLLAVGLALVLGATWRALHQPPELRVGPVLESTAAAGPQGARG